MQQAATAPQPPAPAPATQTHAPELWFYYSTNLQVTDNLKPLEAVWRRAAAAGYTQVLLTDSKFAKLDSVEPVYFENAAKVKKLAGDLHLEIVPAVFPMGWSEALLAHNPNLVESLPVRGALFVVKNGVAQPAPEPGETLAFPDGGFFNVKHWSYADPAVQMENGVAHAAPGGGKNARAMLKLKLTPFHQYHIRVGIRTQGFSGPALVQVLPEGGGDAELNYATLDVKATQYWRDYDVVFNSLDHSAVTISFRAGWDDSKGEVWWRNPMIEPAGLLNIVRRPSAPLSVSVDEAGWEVKEGQYFDPVIDPKMGRTPWPGAYDVWHEPPVMKMRNMPDGTRLSVSFFHAITTDDGKVMITPSEPQTVDLLRDEAKRVDALWHPKRWFMEHDEIRVLGWDPADEARKLDAGPLLADNLRTCTKILRELNPQAKLYVWSDMFDPNHNAHDHYYLAKGSYKGSWEGLDPSVIVANWNFDKWEQSLAWFTGRGNKQLIAGYYDSDPGKITDLLRRADDKNGIEAVMYTTWENKYGDLEKFAAAARSFRNK
ncbi:MAG TPA: hypothetical protein VG733_19505 [Chthoniobacteraceae bacterium]|nr:hypothetical protein [Chthoniobacteraceae bacterium]